MSDIGNPLRTFGCALRRAELVSSRKTVTLSAQTVRWGGPMQRLTITALGFVSGVLLAPVIAVAVPTDGGRIELAMLQQERSAMGSAQTRTTALLNARSNASVECSGSGGVGTYLSENCSSDRPNHHVCTVTFRCRR